MQLYIFLVAFVLTEARVEEKEETAKTDHYNVHIKGTWKVEPKLEQRRHKREGIMLKPGDLEKAKRANCIEKNELSVVHGSQDQQAVVVDLGKTAMLLCHYCDTPEFGTHTSMLWYRFRSKTDPKTNEKIWQAEEVKLDAHDNTYFNRVYTTMDHILLIEDFQPTDVGTYFCEPFQEGLDAITHYTFKSPHIDSTSAVSMSAAWNELKGIKKIDFLYHVDIELPMKAQIVTSDGYNYPKPQPPLVSKKNNWVAFTEWEEWGKCNVCGMVGEHRRRGHCMVKMLNPKKKAQPSFMDHVLRYFIHGAPCHSSLFFNFANIVKRQHETEVEKCEEDCPDSNLPEILDVGNIQINSTIKKPVTPKYKVPTVSLELDMGNPVVMTCLVDKNTTVYKSPNDTDLPIRWQNGTRPIFALLIKNRTRGRIKIDQESILNFTRIKKYENSTYSCWQGESEIRRFILKVNIPKVEVDMWPYMYYLGYSYCADFLLFIIIAALSFRKKKGQVKRVQREKKK